MQFDVQGVLPALITPRRADGSLNLGGLERMIDLVYESGARGIVVAGGTGEYFDLALDQRKALLESAKSFNRGRGTLICANGSGGLEDSVELAEHALAAGIDGLLLPPPHFYRYEQSDLEGYYREAAKRIGAPILVYNLAAFTTPLEPETIVRLIQDVPNLVGVKDSSGNLDSLAALAARPDLAAARVLGHDRVYVEGLRRGLIDAVISGPASAIPEALVRLFENPGDERAALLHEALDHIDPLPYPWALKVISEVRGLFSAALPFSPGERRRRQIEELKAWFPEWLRRLRAAE